MAEIRVAVQWAPSSSNKADKLSRMPVSYLLYAKKPVTQDVSTSAPALRLLLLKPLTFKEIKSVWLRDADLQRVVCNLRDGRSVVDRKFARYQSQLVVHNNVLFRSYVHPIDGVVDVPVILPSLEAAAGKCTHANTGHGNWETMWRSLSSMGFFLGWLQLASYKCSSEASVQLQAQDCEVDLHRQSGTISQLDLGTRSR